MFKDIMSKTVRFEANTDGGSGSQEETPTGGGTQNNDDGVKPVTMTQAELNKIDAETKRKAKEAERKALLEALGVEKLDDAKAIIKAAKDAEEANKSEVDKATKRADTAEANLTKLQSENTDLKLQLKFGQKVEELGWKFVSITAAEDAFKALDRQLVGDDFSGLDKAVEKLQTDRGYLLAKSDGKPPVSPPPADGRQKGKGNQVTLSQEAINNKRSQVAPL
jgi:hypothetical protein